MRLRGVTRWLLVGMVMLAFAAPAFAAAGGLADRMPFSVGDIVATVVYGLIGIILAVVGYYLVDLVTPFSLGKELVEDQNIAVAIVVAALMLGVCHIVASAIR